MSEKDLNAEERRLKSRRGLLKMAVYSIPVISSVLASEDIYANGEDDDKDDDHRAGTGIKKQRKKPNGPKKYKKGLS